MIFCSRVDQYKFRICRLSYRALRSILKRNTDIIAEIHIIKTHEVLHLRIPYDWQISHSWPIIKSIALTSICMYIYIEIFICMKQLYLA